MELPEVIKGYIDSLTDSQRRRIIFAKKWRRGMLVDDDGGRCLVGHAEFTGNSYDEAMRSDEANTLTNKRMAVIMAFDRGHRAHGEPFIDAIKAHASAINSTEKAAV